jgi:hypothetical protein
MRANWYRQEVTVALVAIQVGLGGDGFGIGREGSRE